MCGGVAPSGLPIDMSMMFATAARRQLQLGGDIENVRGKAIDARKAARRVVSVMEFSRKRPEPSERR
jgi:hypothetical protein